MCTHTHTHTHTHTMYYKELTHVTMEAEKFQDLQLAKWRCMTAHDSLRLSVSTPRKNYSFRSSVIAGKTKTPPAVSSPQEKQKHLHLSPLHHSPSHVPAGRQLAWKNSLLFGSCCSVTKSCPTLWDPMDCSTSSFPVLHNLPEFVQTHVYWVSDAIQPPHSLSPPSPAFSLS